MTEKGQRVVKQLKEYSDSLMHECNDTLCGMNLRDWFAGMALQGLLVACHQEKLLDARSIGYQMCIDMISKESWAFADAMLKARGNERA